MFRKSLVVFIFIILVPSWLFAASSTFQSQIGKNDCKFWDGKTNTFSRQTSTGGSLTVRKLGAAVDVAEVYGSGSPSGTALSLAAASITADAVLELMPGTWALTSNLTIPANLVLKIPQGALITIATGVTLTINGPVEAGSYQIFSLTGTGKASFGSATSRVKVQWWGISASVDSSAALNAALASLTGIVDLGAATLKIDSTITVDPAKVAMQGCGAILDATANTGIALQFTGSGSSSPDDQVKWLNQGWELTGNDSAVEAGSIGIKFGSGSDYPAYANFDSVAIHHFETGLLWGNNAWGQKFNKVHIYGCTWPVDYPTGLTNSGEQISFVSSAILDNTNGIRLKGGHFSFTACSIDYNGNRLIDVQGGALIRLLNCHIEDHHDDDYWLYCKDSYSTIIIQGGSLTCAASVDKTKQIGYLQDCGDAGVHIDGLVLIGFATTDHYPLTRLFVTSDTGGGVGLTARNLIPFYLSEQYILADVMNLLSDGGFETNYTTDWTSTGNEVPTVSAADKHAGTNSLKFAPTIAAKTQIIARTAKCRPGDKARMTWWMKNAFGASADTFSVTLGYASADGVVLNAQKKVLTYSAAGTHYDDWTQCWIQPTGGAPAGADSIFIQFGTNASDGNAPVTYIDDVEINTW